MRLRQALRKYSDDMYKRSELVKGELAVRRIPFAFTKQGWIEGLLRDALSDHVQRYGLGRMTGNLGYLIDSERDAPTLRCSALTFIPADRKMVVGEGDFVITPPDVAIEFINQPKIPEYDYPLPAEHENEDSDTYWPTKLEDYRRFGVGLVWIIDLSAEVVHEFRQPEWHSHTYRAGDSLEGGEYLPGFRCRVADLFDLEKLDAGLGLGWKAPLDPALVEYVAARHQKAGLVREATIAEMDWQNLKNNPAQ